MDTWCLRSEINFQLRSYTRNVKFIRISTKMGLFVVAIGIPCIMDVWEGHRELSQTEQCSELLDHARELAVCVEIIISHACVKKHLCNPPISSYVGRP